MQQNQNDPTSQGGSPGRRQAPMSPGDDAPAGTPGGSFAQVVVRQRGHLSRWSRYSSTTGWIGGTSAT